MLLCIAITARSPDFHCLQDEHHRRSICECHLLVTDLFAAGLLRILDCPTPASRGDEAVAPLSGTGLVTSVLEMPVRHPLFGAVFAHAHYTIFAKENHASGASFNKATNCDQFSSKGKT